MISRIDVHRGRHWVLQTVNVDASYGCVDWYMYPRGSAAQEDTGPRDATQLRFARPVVRSTACRGLRKR